MEVAKEIGYETGEVMAEQQFDAWIRKREFAIELQKLAREDIRDLVELTVGRMDISHLVGALLLSFCMTFYFKNNWFTNEGPPWTVSIFLISNFSAVGFLVFAVWLAMHASVAAQSVGTRLLTSQMRLAVPGDKDVDNHVVKRAVRQMMESITNRGDQREKKPGLKRSRSNLESAHFRAYDQHSKLWQGYDEHARFCMAMGINQMLQALSYYIIGPLAKRSQIASASCLIGVQWLSFLLVRLDYTQDPENKWSDRAVVAALVACPPCLASMLMIHYRAENELTPVEVFLRLLATTVFLLHAGWLIFVLRHLPSISSRLQTAAYIGVLDEDQVRTSQEKRDRAVTEAVRVMTERQNELETLLERTAKSWHMQPRAEIQSKWFPEGGTDNLRALFRDRLALSRKPCTLLSAKDREFAQTIVSDIAGHMDPLREVAPCAVREAEVVLHRCEVQDVITRLCDEVEHVMGKEAAAGSMQPCARANNAVIPNISRQLESAMRRTPVCPEHSMARACLSWIDIWCAVPQMYAIFSAINGISESAEWVMDMPDYGVYTDKSHPFQDFLSFCHDLHLGLQCRRDDADVVSCSAAVTDTPYVHATAAGGSRASWTAQKWCWVRLKSRPKEEDDVRFSSAHLNTVKCQHFVSHTLREFLSNRQSEVVPLRPSYKSDVSERSTAAFSVSSPPAAPAPSNGRLSVPFLSEDADEESRDSDVTSQEDKVWIPARCKPDNEKPRLLVRRFTEGVVVLWLVGAVVHVYNVLLTTQSYDCMPPRTLPERGLDLLMTARAPTLSLSQLQVKWPEPSGLFVPSALFCDQSQIFVGNKFTLWAAERNASASHSLGTLERVVGGANMCGEEICVTHDNGGLLGGAPMWGSSGVDEEVDLGSVLPSWRLSTVHPLPCAQPCFSARVAGWDGEEIVVGTVQRAGSGPLNVTLQLAVRPGHGCVGNRCSGVLWSKGRHERNSYRDVRGLRVSGERLTVLLAVDSEFVVDGWELAGSGGFLGRWRLGTTGQPVAMCHDSVRLLLATRVDGKFVLEEGRLPGELRPESTIEELFQ